MPELPEVETMCRGIAAATGCRIRDWRAVKNGLRPIQVLPSPREFRRRVVGRTIAGVTRVGKRVVLALDSSERVVIEPRMTGIVLMDDPPNRSHLRAVFTLESDPVREILFWDQRGLGVMQLFDAEAFARLAHGDRLGPDALTVELAALRARLGASRRPIKPALMDQRALAGIGNLYASEILFAAGVDPARPCAALRPSEWRRIHAAILEVLTTAVRYEGSTLSDGTYRVKREQTGRYQNEHRVYQRAGQPCPRCRRGVILRIVQAQRSTFYCPGCQK